MANTVTIKVEQASKLAVDDLEIIIRGKHKSFKTAIVELLGGLLSRRGFKVTVSDEES